MKILTVKGLKQYSRIQVTLSVLNIAIRDLWHNGPLQCNYDFQIIDWSMKNWDERKKKQKIEMNEWMNEWINEWIVSIFFSFSSDVAQIEKEKKDPDNNNNMKAAPIKANHTNNGWNNALGNNIEPFF